ncbi:MAG: DUF2461 domain-containing protein [Bacteroidetes bacterium]|nr:DUF2461 domain-containing protein [Bacteroidota bacterium]
MITKSTFEFLSDLKENNTREWFQGNKNRYEKAKGEIEGFLSKLIPELSKLDPAIGAPEVKDCMFRIYKDVRFSKDKSPYKTNFGAFVGKGGRKTTQPGYYVHFEPGQSFIAGGIYMPPPDVLKLMRNEIYFNATEFRKIIESKEFRMYFGKLDEFDKMKKAPREYPADFPDLDLLMYRSIIVSKNVNDEVVHSPKYLEYVLEVSKAMLPMHAFLARAINNQ